MSISVEVLLEGLLVAPLAGLVLGLMTLPWWQQLRGETAFVSRSGSLLTI